MAEHETFTEETKAQAGPTIEEARGHAEEAVRSAARRGGGYLYNQKRLAAVEVDGYACALHETAQRLHDQAQDTAARFAERVASSLDSLAYHLREKEIGDLVDRVGDFARRQPAIFIGSAAVAGFMLTRFMKSSESGAGMEEAKAKMREAMASAKERMASAGESTKEEVVRAKESAKEEYTRGKEEAEAKPVSGSEPQGETHEGPSTAADVEIPVIVQPHAPEERPRP